MGDKARPRWVTKEMEEESREWLVRCPVCGHERSIWDLGGIRYKARGTKYIFRRCSDCHQVGWHLVYRQRDGVSLPPLRPARPLRWYIWTLAAILLLFVSLLLGSVLLIVNRAVASSRDDATSYPAAVIAHYSVGTTGTQAKT